MRMNAFHDKPTNTIQLKGLETAVRQWKEFVSAGEAETGKHPNP